LIFAVSISEAILAQACAPSSWPAKSAFLRVSATDNAEDDDENSFAQSVGDAAAAEAARTGGRIVDRELGVRPTIRIRAGGSVRLLVTRDIELRPYREDPRR